MPLHKNLLIGFALAAAILVCQPGVLHGQTTQPAANRIGAIDESSLVVLQGNRHPLATPANDRGEAPSDLPMERMLLVLTRDAESGIRSAESYRQSARQVLARTSTHGFRRINSANDLVLPRRIFKSSQVGSSLTNFR